jgi:diadenosine tetraphosphatase ApaH/serine/threonine PP2A family protein phosphatase
MRCPRFIWEDKDGILRLLGIQIPVVSLGDDFCSYHIDHTPTIRDVSRPKVRENIEYGARCGRYLASNEDSRFYFKGRYFFDKEGEGMDERIPESIPKGNAPELTEE